MKKKRITILAIETSCDDTATALIKAEGGLSPKIKILSNLVSSQIEVHKLYGGIYPLLAKREHQKNLPLLFERAKKEANNPKIDVISVTIGPGLEPSLWVGVNFARSLTEQLNLSLIPINHLEGHIFSSWLPEGFKYRELNRILPALSLIVSGGHTQLTLVEDMFKYKILGETRDDSAGECLDKIARMLGLSYPGGPAIEREASKSKKIGFEIDLPRPMLKQKNYDFSFSGLKTAVFYDFKKKKPAVRKNRDYIRAVATESQQAIIDVLIKKTLKAAKDYRARAIVLGGGVSANQELRKQLGDRIKKELPKTRYYLPKIEYCTDNALMIAITAYYHWLLGDVKDWKDVTVNANLKL